MSELNPNHPVTQAIHDHWHKLCGILVVKLGVTKVEITEQDIHALEGCNILFYEKDKKITLELVDDETARAIVEKEGGLPI
jgi:hypothetical protein